MGNFFGRGGKREGGSFVDVWEERVLAVEGIFFVNVLSKFMVVRFKFKVVVVGIRVVT